MTPLTATIIESLCRSAATRCRTVQRRELAFELQLGFRSVGMAASPAYPKKRPRASSSASDPLYESVTTYKLDGLYENTSTLHPALLHRRYKRFLGDVTLGSNPRGSTEPSISDEHDNSITTVHVPNTGPMTGLLDALPAQVCLSKSSNEKRKYAYTLEWMKVDDTWVGVHSAKANAMVSELLDAGVLNEHLPPFTRYQREVRLGARGAKAGKTEEAEISRGDKKGGSKGPASATRIDFELINDDTNTRCLMEVKSVTMKDGDTAVFPDTKSERAQKHVKELLEWKGKNGTAECVMLYVVQRDDCTRFLPCKEKDPVYYDLVQQGVREGLKVLVVQVGLEENGGEYRVVYKGSMELGEMCEMPETTSE